MNIQVGAGGVLIEGFKNVDIRDVPGVDIVADACELDTIKTGEVEILFGHAVFEHFFLGHQLAALREWKRVIARDGLLIMLAIPDFEAIARLYLNGASGVMGERFDLHNVYRYTHGEPEHATQPVWPVWRATNGKAPKGWIPQLHKSLFDASYLRELLAECGFQSIIFNYAYPGEKHALNLGFIATELPMNATNGSLLKDIRATLNRIPNVGKFANLDSIVVSESRKSTEGLLLVAKSLESNRAITTFGKIKRRLGRMLSSFLAFF